MLLPEEWPYFRAAASVGTKYSVPGQHRVAIYTLAIETGYRANEIRELQIHNIGSTEKSAWVSLLPHQTKNKKASKQYISPKLHQQLQELVGSRPGDDKIFKFCGTSNTARMIRKDLLAAREAWINEAKDDEEKKQRTKSEFLASPNFAGETLDFHTLRHTCGAWLTIQGVHPKTVQKIMRHSSIQLTFDTYGHLMPDAESNAVDLLSSMLDNRDQCQ
jgi:integrase